MDTIHGLLQPLAVGKKRHVTDDELGRRPRATAAVCIAIISVVAESVLGKPCMVIARLSPTRMQSTLDRSTARALE